MKTDLFDEKNQVKSNWMKFGLEGDFISGTLVAKRTMKNALKEGSPDQAVYEIKVQSGSFHDIDEKKKVMEKATIINEGDIYNVGGKPGLDAQMRNVKLGQILGIKFVEEVPSKTKGYNATKILKVFTAGEMDSEFMAGVGAPVDDGFGPYSDK